MSEQHATNGNGHNNDGMNGHNGMNGHSKRKHAMNAYYATELEAGWKEHTRWKGIVRPYRAEDVIRLRVAIKIDYTLERLGAQLICNLLQAVTFLSAFGALSG